MKLIKIRPNKRYRKQKSIKLNMLHRSMPFMIFSAGFILLLIILLIVFGTDKTTNNKEDLVGIENLNKVLDKSAASISAKLVLDDNSQLVDFAIGKIDGTGNDNILALVGDNNASYANELIIYSTRSNHINEIYRNNIAAINPWKIAICNIDDDGIPEIFIATNKKAHYYQKVENRPFFFNFIDGILVKKWTGSKFRAPFVDVCFFDINGDGTDEVIVIEEITNKSNTSNKPNTSNKLNTSNYLANGYVISVYYWFGFGFTLLAESNAYQIIDNIDLIINDDKRYLQVMVNDGNKFKTVFLTPSNEKTANDIYLLKETEFKN